MCRTEIGYYHHKDQDCALTFIDISESGSRPPNGISQERAMNRLHFRANDGHVLSGAAAFVEVWTWLPGLRCAARAAALPGALLAMELGYRIFLPVRPFISRFFWARSDTSRCPRPR